MIKKWFIYSDFAKWDKQINEFEPDKIFVGDYEAAHKFAQNRYGKYYVIHENPLQNETNSKETQPSVLPD